VTVIVTAPILLPLPSGDIPQEVVQQLVNLRKSVGLFSSPKVAVIALTQLVVVAQDALASHHIGKPVPEPMQRNIHWLRKTPDHYLDKPNLQNAALTKEQFGFHVAEINNTLKVLSIETTPGSLLS